MNSVSSPRAKLLVDIPAGRYTLLSAEGRPPRAGDTVLLDQGFTSEDGRPMVLAYFPADLSCQGLYSADVYESELE